MLNTMKHHSDTLQLAGETRHLEEAFNHGIEGLRVLHETVKRSIDVA